MKQSAFFFAVASLRRSVHAHERSLRSGKAETQCTDTVGWVDFLGYGCDWYEENELPFCPRFGKHSYDGGMGAAIDNCCYCMFKADPQCTETVGWVDSEGDGCDWYEVYDSPFCPYYGDSYDGGMGVANDNCCYCAGTAVSVFTLVIPRCM
jgi:hypothetical protein